MNPTWFYRKNYLGKTVSQRGKSKNQTIINETMVFFNGKYPMEFLNDLDVPNKEEIHSYQMRMLQSNAAFAVDERTRKNIKDYNDAVFYTNANGKKFTIEDMIQIVEKVFNEKFTDSQGNRNESLGYKVLSGNVDNITILQNEYNNIIQNLYEIINFLGSGFNGNIPSLNKDEFNSKMDRIKIALQSLEKDLATMGTSSSDGYESLKSGSNNSSLKNYIQNLGYVIKARISEINALKFGNQIPLPSGEAWTLDTSRIKGPVYNILGKTIGTGQSLRNDALVFSDTVLDSLQIEYEVAPTGESDKKVEKKCTLREFFNVIENASKNYETIYVDEDMYETLINKAVYGIQAKSGYGQSPFNNFKVTPMDAVEVARFKGEETNYLEWKALLYFILWHNDMHHTVANHNIYNAYFNLCISHDLTYAIGQKNSLLAARDGIYPLIDYIEDQWRTAHKIVQAKQLISLGKDGSYPVNVNLSGTNI